MRPFRAFGITLFSLSPEGAVCSKGVQPFAHNSGGSSKINLQESIQFESRLAHVHGNLFAFLNILIGYLLLHFRGKLQNIKTISWLALTGLLMPIGILSEVYFGLPPALVLIGAMAMTASVIWLGVAFFKMKNINE